MAREAEGDASQPHAAPDRETLGSARVPAIGVVLGRERQLRNAWDCLLR